MVIVVAKMKADGIWDALEVKDGQLYWVGGNQGSDSYTTSSVTINNCDIGAAKIVGYGTWPKSN